MTVDLLLRSEAVCRTEMRDLLGAAMPGEIAGVLDKRAQGFSDLFVDCEGRFPGRIAPSVLRVPEEGLHAPDRPPLRDLLGPWKLDKGIKPVTRYSFRACG